jgi:hypothetical protein
MNEVVPGMPSKPTVRFQGKTTYILGAGFSAAAGIPTMRNFLPSAFELLKRYEANCYANTSLTAGLAELINSKRAIAANSDLDLGNIEDLFCLVERTREVDAMQHDDVMREDAGGEGKGGEHVTRSPHKRLIDVIVSTLCLAYLQQEVLLNKADKRLTDLMRKRLEIRGSPLRRRAARGCTVPQRHLFSPTGIQYRGKPCDSTFNFCVYEAFWSYVLNCQAKRQENAGPPENPFKADAIITPNYDVVLEEKLRHFVGAKIFYGKGIAYSPHDLLFMESWSPPRAKRVRVGIPIIKLHGSINWRLPEADGVGTRALSLPTFFRT